MSPECKRVTPCRTNVYKRITKVNHEDDNTSRGGTAHRVTAVSADAEACVGDVTATSNILCVHALLETAVLMLQPGALLGLQVITPAGVIAVPGDVDAIKTDVPGMFEIKDRMRR